MNAILKHVFRVIIFLSLFLLVLMTAACDDKNKVPDPLPDGGDEADIAHRTVLVYIVAANSLGSSAYDADDIKEMVQGVNEGQLGNGRLLVYHSQRSKAPLLKEITTEGIDTLATYDVDDVSVSIEQMTRVFKDMKELAPADDYALVLWSHSHGWLQDGIAEAPANMMYSWGSDNGKKMNITSLQQALIGQDFSFVYFDCCYMGSVEVAYQLRNVVPVIVAAPTEVSVLGMPYHLNLKHFFAESPDLEAAAQSTYDYYIATYNKWDCPLSMSVIHTDKLADLALATRKIYELADVPWPEDYSPQRYSSETPCYYYDFKDYVETLAGERLDLLEDWQRAMDAVAPFYKCAGWIWSDIEVTRAGGLSTYILQDAEAINIKNYYTLSWYDDVASSLLKPDAE